MTAEEHTDIDTAGTGECKHAMAAGTCVDCRPRRQKPTFGRNVVESWNSSKEAEFESDCDICGGLIEIGEPITYVDTDGWVHAEC